MAGALVFCLIDSDDAFGRLRGAFDRLGSAPGSGAELVRVDSGGDGGPDRGSALTLSSSAGRRPFALLGHGSGAAVAAELTRDLHGRGLPLPRRLYVCGAVPPAGVGSAPEPLPVPVVALAAHGDDTVWPARMLAWSRHTSRPFSLHTVSGPAELSTAGAAEIARLVSSDLTRPERPRSLGAEDVRLVVADVDLLPDLALAAAELSPAESARNARLRTPLLRARHVSRRVLLRRILRGYGAPVGSADLPVSTAGKPYVDGAGDLRFNMSSSGELVLVGLTRGGEIGVDVELTRAIPDLDSFPAGALHAAERTAIQTLPASQRLGAVLQLWAAKESLLKGSGDGLGIEPDQISFAGCRDERTWQAHVPEQLSRLREWNVTPVPLPGAAAAFAVALPAARLHLESLTPLPLTPPC